MREKKEPTFDTQVLIKNDNPQPNFQHKIYGRVIEQKILENGIGRHKKGDYPILYIYGDAGIGKSYFVKHAFKNHLDFVVFNGQHEQYHQNSSFSGFQQCLDQMYHSIDGINWAEIVLEKFNGFETELIEIAPFLEKFVKIIPEVHEERSQFHHHNKTNQVIHTLIQVLTHASKHTCVIHLDDIQWMNNASFETINYLINSELKSCFIVLSSRNLSEPKHDSLEHLKQLLDKENEWIDIELRPLSVNAIQLLLEDLFEHSDSDMASLTDVCFNQSNGNPYILTQVISNLSRTGQILFDKKTHKWQWHFGNNLKQTIENQLKALFEVKLNFLSEEYQNILMICACFGATLNVQFISRISGIDQTKLKLVFQEASNLNFIIKAKHQKHLSKEDVSIYEFTHDLIIEHLRKNLQTTQKNNIHKKIVHYYLTESVVGILDKNVLELAYHLNAYIDDNASKKQKELHAEINLKAIAQLKKSAAYNTALTHLEHALRFNIHRDWKDNRQLASRIHIEGYQVARFNSNNTLALQLFNNAISNCNHKDVLEIMLSKINIDLHQGALQEALDTGLQALKMVGVKVASNANKLAVGKEFISTKWMLRKHTKQSVFELPEMTDENAKTAFKIIFLMFRSANYLNPELNGVLSLKILQLMLKKGSHPEGFAGFMAYGIIIGAGTNNYKEAYKYCEIGDELAKRYNNDSSTLHLGRGIYLALKKPLRKTFSHYALAKKIGLQEGDFIAATEPTVNEGLTHLASGIPLYQVIALVKENIRACVRAGTKDFEEFNRVLSFQLKQYVGIETTKEEQTRIRHILEHTEYRLTRSISGIINLQKACLEERWQDAEGLVKTYTKDVPYLSGLYVSSEFFFFKGIVLAKNSAHSSILNRIQRKRQLRQIIKKMYKWSSSVEANHKHKVLMLEGLLAEINGKHSKAHNRMLLAASEAEKEKFIQNAAIAYRTLSQFSSIAIKDAKRFKDKADRLFNEWGFKSSTNALMP